MARDTSTGKTICRPQATGTTAAEALHHKLPTLYNGCEQLQKVKQTNVVGTSRYQSGTHIRMTGQGKKRGCGGVGGGGYLGRHWGFCPCPAEQHTGPSRGCFGGAHLGCPSHSWQPPSCLPGLQPLLPCYSAQCSFIIITSGHTVMWTYQAESNPIQCAAY